MKEPENYIDKHFEAFFGGSFIGVFLIFGITFIITYNLGLAMIVTYIAMFLFFAFLFIYKGAYDDKLAKYKKEKRKQELIEYESIKRSNLEKLKSLEKCLKRISSEKAHGTEN